MKLIPDLIKKITDNEIWKSVFRHGYADTPRNRVLQIISNVWLHLHPAKVREHGTKIRFTWCMGGITFFLFLFETITGILLMFYYVLLDICCPGISWDIGLLPLVRIWREQRHF